MNFYIANIIFVAFSVMIYFCFRGGVYDYLRYTKNSKTYIKKNKKGFVNYWTYCSIHKESNMGIVYYLNLAMLFAVLIYSVFAIGFGWLKLMQIPITIVSALFAVIAIPSLILTYVYANKLEFGKAIVLFKYRKYGRHFPIVELLDSFLPLIFFAVNIYLLITF